MGASKDNKNALGNEGGAPTKYKYEYAKQAYELCLLGYTDKQLAAFFEVNVDTIYEWRKVNVEFSDKVIEGKTLADAKVAAAMFKRAVGFEYDEVTFEKIDSKINLEVTSTGQIKTDEAYKKKVVTKLVIPDTGAQMNWLKNRQKELWRDKQDIGLDFDKLSDEQLDLILNRLLEKHQNNNQ